MDLSSVLSYLLKEIIPTGNASVFQLAIGAMNCKGGIASQKDPPPPQFKIYMCPQSSPAVYFPFTVSSKSIF